MLLSRKTWIFTISLAALLLSGCGLSLAEDVTPPPNYRPPAQQQSPDQPAGVSTVFPVVPPDPAQGAPIYAEKCLPCHGEYGMGDGPQAADLPNPAAPIGSPDFARETRPIEWFMVVTYGNLERFMPGFSGSLNDRQRWDVVAYAYSLSLSDESVAQGKVVYEASCAECHGITGKGDGEQAASLSVRPASWDDQSRLARLSGLDIAGVISQGQVLGKDPGSHPNFAGQLDVDQQLAVSDYIRSLSFASAPGEGQAAAQPQGTPVAQNTPEAAGTPNAADQPVDTITITGVVTNRTPGGTVPGELEAKLTAFSGMQPAFETTAPVAADGTYTFRDVEFAPDYVYFAQVDANGLTFNSDILHGSDVTGASAELPVEVYDTTSDQSALRTDRLHIFFDFTQPGRVQVVNLFIISNAGDKVVVPEEVNDPVVRFPVPEGAENLMFQDGELGGRFVETENGFGDRMSIAPGAGQQQVLYAYELPYDRKLSIDVASPLPVDAAIVMLPPAGVRLKSDQLVDAGQRDVQGMAFQMYQATSSLAAGEALNLNLSGKVGIGDAAETNQTTYVLLGGGVFGLALLGAGLWLYRQRAQAGDEEMDDESELEDAEQEESSEAILEAIVALDDQHTAGDMPEDAYQERRAALKARLAEALEREKAA